MTLQVVGFCCDERERLGRAIDYADVYHSANRYATSSRDLHIVLPRSISWAFQQNRLLHGVEHMAIQGHTVKVEVDSASGGKGFTSSQLTSLAGNAFFGFCAVKHFCFQL